MLSLITDSYYVAGRQSSMTFVLSLILQCSKS